MKASHNPKLSELTLQKNLSLPKCQIDTLEPTFDTLKIILLHMGF